MGELITSLGIDARLLIAQLINFLILFLVLRKFLYQPLLTMLDKRRATIEANVEKEKALESTLSSAEAEKEEVLREAKKEAQAILENARKTAEETGTRIVQEAEKKAEATLARGESELVSRKQEFDKALMAEASNLIATSVERIIPGVLTPESERKLRDEAVKSL